MTRRRATILLHWLVLTLLMLALASGLENAALLTGFAVAGLAMVALGLVFGLMNGPGPRLEGGLRSAHPWLNRAMYGLLACACASTLALAAGTTLPGPTPRTLMVVLFAASALHGIFNLWRHTALGDGALRRMTPKALHGML